MIDWKSVTCLSDITEDVIDSRDLAQVLKSLEGEDEAELDDEQKELLSALQELRDNTSSSGWRYGITFISEDYWEEYCREFADDVGMIDEKSPLSNYIDWGKWADDMQSDYSSIEINGCTYYWQPA
jgi:hypothetical protein